MLFGILAFLFIAIPVAELHILWLIGSRIGILPTLALVVVTGIIGAHLARQQGIKVINNINSQLSSGHMPTDELLSGALVLVGGVMLLTPGIITDCCGLLLMIPLTRSFIGRQLKKCFAARLNIVNITPGFNPSGAGFNRTTDEIKEADAHVVEDDNDK